MDHQGASAGGILGLHALLDAPGVREAVTYDLLTQGRSIHQLGSPALSWAELKAVMKWAPTTSAVARNRDQFAAYHTPEADLLMSVLDALHAANWQRSGCDGPRPTPTREALTAQVQKAEQEASAPKSLEELATIRAQLAEKLRPAR